MTKAATHLVTSFEESPGTIGLRGREDMRDLVLQLWRPLLARGSQARCCPGATGAVYGSAAAGMEGFCRPLWAVLACAAGGDPLPGTGLLRGAIRSGTNPNDPDFWGKFMEADQRCVEMAVLGWALSAAPAAFWEELDLVEQERLANWLNQINQAKNLPTNNWRFFRILVNAGLRAASQAFSGERMEEDLSIIESCHLGDGWYSDGRGTQRDYYVGMAMHFYGLLLAAQDAPGLSEHTRRYRERARLFARQLIHWFVPDGSALAYGRSLTYRFAQAAFWSALIWAGEEALPWGVIKGLLLRHIRWWMAQPIFDNGGVLSIGYRYPNLQMAESYNSPASPYWAMKALLPAGLPEDHPFWLAEEQPLPEMPVLCAQPQPGFLIRRHDGGRHITVLASGQYPDGWHVRHAPEKYSKFAYGTRFGFSVPVGPITLEDGAHDNMLALSDDGHHWRVREKCDEARLENNILISKWSPWPDVCLRTWLFFDAEWQVRVHRLDTARDLQSAEGGHAVPQPDADVKVEESCVIGDPARAFAISDGNAAGLIDPLSSRMGAVVAAAPNSNLLNPRTMLPTLRGEHSPGVEWLVTLLPVPYDPAAFLALLEPAVGVDTGEDRISLRLPSGRVLDLGITCGGRAFVRFDEPEAMKRPVRDTCNTAAPLR